MRVRAVTEHPEHFWRPGRGLLVGRAMRTPPSPRTPQRRARTPAPFPRSSRRPRAPARYGPGPSRRAPQPGHLIPGPPGLLGRRVGTGDLVRDFLRWLHGTRVQGVCSLPLPHALPAHEPAGSRQRHPPAADAPRIAPLPGRSNPPPRLDWPARRLQEILPPPGTPPPSELRPTRPGNSIHHTHKPEDTWVLFDYKTSKC